MVRYRVRTYVYAGRPLSLVLRRVPVVPAEGITEAEVVLEPFPFWSVGNLRASLLLEVDLGKGRGEFLSPPDQPEWFQKEAEKDIVAQGGAINISGWYDVRSARVRRWLERKVVQNWLRQELERLGLEMVK